MSNGNDWDKITFVKPVEAWVLTESVDNLGGVRRACIVHGTNKEALTIVSAELINATHSAIRGVIVGVVGNDLLVDLPDVRIQVEKSKVTLIDGHTVRQPQIGGVEDP